MECRLIKLINGETIIVQLDIAHLSANESADKMIEVFYPMLVVSARVIQNGMIYETSNLQTWMKFSKDVSMRIPIQSILTITEVKDNIVKQYARYVNDSFNNQYIDYQNEEDTEEKTLADFFDEIEREYGHSYDDDLSDQDAQDDLFDTQQEDESVYTYEYPRKTYH